jgi:hypothetical protein
MANFWSLNEAQRRQYRRILAHCVAEIRRLKESRPVPPGWQSDVEGAVEGCHDRGEVEMGMVLAMVFTIAVNGGPYGRDRMLAGLIHLAGDIDEAPSRSAPPFSEN